MNAHEVLELDSVIRRALRVITKSVDIEDLAQDTWVNILGRSKLEAIRKKPEYVFRTAANTAKDHWKRLSARKRQPRELPIPSTPTPEELLLAHEQMRILAAEVTRLNGWRPAIFTQLYLGHKYTEMAQLCGVAPKTASKYVTTLWRELCEEGQ